MESYKGYTSHCLKREKNLFLGGESLVHKVTVFEKKSFPLRFAVFMNNSIVILSDRFLEINLCNIV